MNLRLKENSSPAISSSRADIVAFILRVGLGFVFVIGGWWKLSRAIDPELSGALVQQYLAGQGYINTFFSQYLFEGALGDFFSPLMFLTALSTFELVAGLALIAGMFVRSLSFIFAFLLWAFVIALPVTTTPGPLGDVSTYLSPALLVQIRDIGLSGMFFVLLNLGSGRWALDKSLFGRGYLQFDMINWNANGLLLRLSVALVFLTGGVFAGFDHIKSYIDVPQALILVGLVLAIGHFVRPAAFVAATIVLWYLVTHIDPEGAFWNNLNGVKREIAFLAATGVLATIGGGQSHRLGALFASPLSTLVGARRPKR